MCEPSQALRAEINGYSQALRATSNGVEATPSDLARRASLGTKINIKIKGAADSCRAIRGSCGAAHIGQCVG
jgi:hypothetical protein